METKNYKVYFATTSVGKDGVALTKSISDAHNEYGQHFPIVDMGSEGHQIRDLKRVRNVWFGVFARLRPDAPHIVNGKDEEREIDLNADDRVLDKCHFLYKEKTNTIVWQVNKNAGGLTRMQEYLSRIFDEIVMLPLVMNEAELNMVLNRDIYEISFSYSRPPSLSNKSPQWNQRTFDTMNDIHASHAKFLLRASRGGFLMGGIKKMLKDLVKGQEAEKIRVRLTDESDPIDLFLAPLRDSLTAKMVGRYPNVKDVYVGLEGCYDKHRNFFG